LPPVLGQHVDVGEIDERDAVRERPGEADLPLAVVDADYALCLADQPLNHFVRPPLRPVGLVREVVVHRGNVDPARVVVELECHG
jgi:hypothetical protein